MQIIVNAIVLVLSLPRPSLASEVQIDPEVKHTVSIQDVADVAGHYEGYIQHSSGADDDVCSVDILPLGPRFDSYEVILRAKRPLQGFDLNAPDGTREWPSIRHVVRAWGGHQLSGLNDGQVKDITGHEAKTTWNLGGETTWTRLFVWDSSLRFVQWSFRKSYSFKPFGPPDVSYQLGCNYLEKR